MKTTPLSQSTLSAASHGQPQHCASIGRRLLTGLMLALALVLSVPQSVHASNIASETAPLTSATALKTNKTSGTSVTLAASTKTIALKKITLNKTSATVKTGNTITLKVSYTPTNTTASRTVKWTSSDTSIATVKKGKVTGVKPGKVTITAKVGKKKATCQVTVKSKYPLKSISLNKKTASIKVGNSVTLSVKYQPANTTDDKTVKWSSSDTSVATVKKGKVTGKKAGTVTITAKVGKKKATCQVTVKKKATNYKNVTEAYTLLNQFRTNPANQWYWDTDNVTKIQTESLKALSRNTKLEEVAKTRAAEQWIQFYENGYATHTRPDGSECFSIYPDTLDAMGENLAWGQTSCAEVMDAWIEEFENYDEQGHRRNLLCDYFTKVGIACYSKDGLTCWAMCLGA